jgi:hypothetical protein
VRINVEIRQGSGSARALRALGLPPRSEIITLIRTRTAEGTPVADVTDVVPVALLSEAGITVQEMTALVTQTDRARRLLGSCSPAGTGRHAHLASLGRDHAVPRGELISISKRPRSAGWQRRRSRCHRSE